MVRRSSLPPLPFLRNCAVFEPEAAGHLLDLVRPVIFSIWQLVSEPTSIDGSPGYGLKL